MVQHPLSLYPTESLLLYVLRFLCTVASFYYSDTPEERQILVHLPKLKGGCISFPSREETPIPQRCALLWKKLLICGIRFDFKHDGEEAAREMKRSTLLELMDASESMG